MKVKRTTEDWVIDSISYILIALLAVATLLPFLNVFSKSVSEEWAVVSGKVGLLPVGFQLDTLWNVIASGSFINAFGISIVVTVAGTALGVFLMAMFAYALSKKRLFGMRAAMVVCIFTMIFNGGIIPNYLLIRELGLYNTLWALILPNAINVYHVVIIKSYYDGIPESIEEAAKIDGATNISTFFRIIMPLAVPVYATITLFLAVLYWNNYMDALMYINEPTLKPLQLYLRDIILEQESAASSLDDALNMSPEGVRSATVIASTIPILLVYPFVQRYFVKGIMVGSVKG